MSPTFKEIWTSDGWAGYWLRTNGRVAHKQTYFQVRSVIRIAIWMPITVYVYLGLTGWLV